MSCYPTGAFWAGSLLTRHRAKALNAVSLKFLVIPHDPHKEPPARPYLHGPPSL